MRSSVALVHHPDIQSGIAQALDLAGDLGDLVRGKHVAVKPNDTWASPDDLTACTQADTVRAVIRYLKRFEPARITVSGGSGDGETDEIFGLLGIDRAIREEDVAFFDHNRPPFKSVRLDYSPQSEVMVNPHIFEYDTLISLAQHKVHNSATVTLTMKNIAMSFPAADYYGHPREAGLHPHRFFEDLQAFIAGMCKRFPPHLGIIVGHPAMIGRGPLGGRVFESELVIAGRDFVACDAVGAALLGKTDVRHIMLGQELGLGTAALEEIEIRGTSFALAQSIFDEKILSAQRA